MSYNCPVDSIVEWICPLSHRRTPSFVDFMIVWIHSGTMAALLWDSKASAWVDGAKAPSSLSYLVTYREALESGGPRLLWASSRLLWRGPIDCLLVSAPGYPKTRKVRLARRWVTSAYPFWPSFRGCRCSNHSAPSFIDFSTNSKTQMIWSAHYHWFLRCCKLWWDCLKYFCYFCDHLDCASTS